MRKIDALVVLSSRFQFMLIFTVTRAIGELLVVPEDVNATVGEKVVFNCKTNIIDEPIWWLLNGTHEIVYVGNLASEFKKSHGYELEVDRTSGVFNLVIPFANWSHAGEYTCVDDNNEGQRASAFLRFKDQAVVAGEQTENSTTYFKIILIPCLVIGIIVIIGIVVLFLCIKKRQKPGDPASLVESQPVNGEARRPTSNHTGGRQSSVCPGLNVDVKEEQQKPVKDLTKFYDEKSPGQNVQREIGKQSSSQAVRGAIIPCKTSTQEETTKCQFSADNISNLVDDQKELEKGHPETEGTHLMQSHQEDELMVPDAEDSIAGDASMESCVDNKSAAAFNDKSPEEKNVEIDDNETSELIDHRKDEDEAEEKTKFISPTENTVT